MLYLFSMRRWPLFWLKTFLLVYLTVIIKIPVVRIQNNFSALSVLIFMLIQHLFHTQNNKNYDKYKVLQLTEKDDLDSMIKLKANMYVAYIDFLTKFSIPTTHSAIQFYSLFLRKPWKSRKAADLSQPSYLQTHSSTFIVPTNVFWWKTKATTSLQAGLFITLSLPSLCSLIE